MRIGEAMEGVLQGGRAMKRFAKQRSLWLFGQLGVIAALALLLTVAGRRIVDLKRAPPGLVAMMTLVPLNSGEALISAGQAMSARDIASALDYILDVQFQTGNRAADGYRLSKSSSTSVWRGICAATHLAARRERQATEALKTSLTRAFSALRPQSEYHPFEYVEPSTFWRHSSLPLENYLWALVQIEGFDGHRWVERSLRVDTECQAKWAEDVTFFTSVLSFAGYENEIDTAEWPWTKPNAFDERWPLRFAVAARRRGHDIDLDNPRKLTGDLIALIANFKPDLRHIEGVGFEEFWLAVSASILLAELQPRQSIRRIFPLGAGQDVDLVRDLEMTGIALGGANQRSSEWQIPRWFSVFIGVAWDQGADSRQAAGADYHGVGRYPSDSSLSALLLM